MNDKTKKTLKILKVIKLKGPSVLYTVKWTPDSSSMLICSNSHSIFRYNLKGKSDLEEIEGHLGEVKAVSCSADGLLYASKGGVNDNTLEKPI